MRKYFASLIPFLFCTVLSFIYAARTPREFSDPAYPYQTEGTLSYLSTTWFYIGIIISAVFILMSLIGDIFDYFVKVIEKKRQRK